MSERDQIYVQILHVGLLALHNASYGGDAAYWKIESDHLHNLPSLIGDPNEHRHAYYFDQERVAYLDAVQGTTVHDFTLIRYRELWAQLERLRPKE